MATPAKRRATRGEDRKAAVGRAARGGDGSRAARGKAAEGRDAADDRAARPYHHGDLPAALVDATFELVAEKGLQGFSVAEAARRTGVSAAAPYRHFSDRDELLAAAATRAAEELTARFRAALADELRAADRLAAASAAYVRFAAERRPMFEVLFGAGLEKQRYPRLAAATGRLTQELMDVARELAPNRDPNAAGALMLAIAGLAQGHATLLLDHMFGSGAEAVEAAAERAAAATRALVRGRTVLFAELRE